jgi:hypothetical protein
LEKDGFRDSLIIASLAELRVCGDLGCGACPSARCGVYDKKIVMMLMITF